MDIQPRLAQGPARWLLPWGKLGPEWAYHPAVFHMLDVGHVAQLLLSSAAPRRFRSVLARALDTSSAGVQGRVPLLVALHDIGKISGSFQGQDSKPQTRAARERLAAQGFTFGETHGHFYPHQQISAVWTQGVWPQLEPELPERLVRAERDALAGHHGVFGAPGELTEVRRYLRRGEPLEWAELRRQAYQALRDLLAGDGAAWPDPHHLRAATMALAGFTILCDWIGSDSSHFPCEPDLSLAEYAPLSRQRAAEALGGVGLLSSRPHASYDGFCSLFPDITDPRPLQTTIDNLPPSVLAWPSLFVIEAPTGEGKTEAALALATRLAEVGPSDELYFGLPTQATSNQMYGRVHEFLGRRHPGAAALRLIHGQSHLVQDDLALRFHEDADGGSAAAASEWFAPKKRALLAPFGVGTVDQVELTTLSARHYMLRMFGLSGKAVIIDEVHAYDTYMSTILEEAISWLAAMGSSVILLSATLPVSRHRALAEAFYRGVGEGTPPEPADMLPYPSLACYTPRQLAIESPAASQPSRELQVTFVADDGLEEQCRRLLDAVRSGGAVCRVCNTVAEAQSVYAAVRSADPSVNSLLLHSRFPLDERQAIEARLMAHFGPNTTRSNAERWVVIGTQILEQSLDLDFDAMVSDHAPLDLLLQRAGRLHRHRRDRPPALSRPVLEVQLLADAGGRPNYGPSASVYDPFILWTSWLALQSRQEGGSVQLALPADYRPMIEAAYPQRGESAFADSPFSVEIQAAYAEHLKEEETLRGEAGVRLAPPPDPDAGITEGVALVLDEDDEGTGSTWGTAFTRLGAPGIPLIPLHRIGDGLAVDPKGREPLPRSCDRTWQLRLLRRSIPVTISAARRPLLGRWEADRAAHAGLFSRESLLRHALPLILERGRQQNGRYTLELCPELGLTIGKEDG